jgi:hypothetical protein
MRYFIPLFLICSLSAQAGDACRGRVIGGPQRFQKPILVSTRAQEVLEEPEDGSIFEFVISLFTERRRLVERLIERRRADLSGAMPLFLAEGKPRLSATDYEFALERIRQLEELEIMDANYSFSYREGVLRVRATRTAILQLLTQQSPFVGLVRMSP